MNVLSLLSTMLATAFLIGGVYCLTRNRKVNLNLASFLVLLSLGWWSFCNAFFFSAATEAAAWRWHHLAALGWTGFIAVTTYYFIILTGLHEKMKKLWIQLAYCALPTALLLHNLFGTKTTLAVEMTKSRLGGQWTYVNTLDNMWLWIYLFCLTLYFGFSFCLLLHWAKSVRHPSKKHMAFLFVALDILTILTGFVTDVIFPLTSRAIPPIANLGTAIFGAGYFLIIIRYDVFNIRYVVEDREIIEHSMEALMVTDESGEILDVNSACAELLETSRAKLLGGSGTAYFSDADCRAVSEQLRTEGTVAAAELPLSLPGGEKQLLVSGAVIRNRKKEYLGTVFSLRDMTQFNALQDQYRRKSEEYEKLAYMDTLTELPNRRKTFDYLFRCAKRYAEAGENFFVLFIDINDFKAVNDQYGHDIGDQYLRAATKRMAQCLYDGLRFLGRLGGDEFLVVGFSQDGGEMASDMQRLNDAFSAEFVFGDAHICGGVSMGCALYSQHENVDDMIRHADEQMYVMKNGELGATTHKIKGRSHERV